MSQQRKDLGERAEKRVMNLFIKEHSAIFDEKKIYPDFTVGVLNNKIVGRPINSYAVEVKTTSGYNGYDRIGKFCISRQEFEAYEEISNKIKVVLILEIRPKSYNWRNYIYIVIPWNPIRKRFLESSPDQLTLSVWWAILKGHNLKDWLKYVG